MRRAPAYDPDSLERSTGDTLWVEGADGERILWYRRDWVLQLSIWTPASDYTPGSFIKAPVSLMFLPGCQRRLTRCAGIRDQPRIKPTRRR
jgi:hypothetical protein